MKLQELAKNKTQQVSKVMESHFNAKIDVSKLNLEQAKTLLAKTSAIVAEVQSSTNRHTSQSNPAYLKALMMQQALSEPYAGGTGQQKSMPSMPTQGITDEEDDEIEESGGGEPIGAMSDQDLADYIGSTEAEVKKDREAAEEAAQEKNQDYAESSCGTHKKKKVRENTEMGTLDDGTDFEVDAPVNIYVDGTMAQFDQLSQLCTDSTMNAVWRDIIAYIQDNRDSLGEAVEITNERFTKKDYADNEANNLHAENALAVVMQHGSKQEQATVMDINKRHAKAGSISSADQARRDAIAKKYMSRLPESKQINEADVGDAQVTLAAQDVVDRITKMYEDIAEMQYKDLPNLAQTMKQEIGINQTQAYYDGTNQAISTLIGALETAKSDLEKAMGPITGEASIDAGAVAPELGDEADIGVDDEEAIQAEPEASIDTDLGREKR